METIIDEHYVPEQGFNLDYYLQLGDIAGVHHIIRYLWAMTVIADMNEVKIILDVACGAGYGSFEIAQKFPNIRVIGCDYDIKAINIAKQRYCLPNLEYCCGDTTNWDETIGDLMFDCILSFDTIEHVSHREIMMENIVEHLNSNGNLLFSTPCGNNRNILNPDWKFHKVEFSSASLYDFLSRYFKAIYRPDDSSLPRLEVFSKLEGSKVGYLLQMNPLVCRNPINIVNPYKTK